MSNRSTTILVTGANGFIGKSACLQLHAEGYIVRAAVRRPFNELPLEIEQVVVSDISSADSWKPAVTGIEVIIHLAGMTQAKKTDANALESFRLVNRDGTAALLKSAKAAKVRRLVNVSSIAVLGQTTDADPFSSNTVPRPYNDYAVSKLEAEQILSSETGDSIECVTVRPPIVYGPGNTGAFLTLLKLIDKGLPLPFGAAHGERDMIYVDHLIDVLALCISNPNVVGKTYVVCDEQPISTSALIKLLAKNFHKRVPLIPIPEWLIVKVAQILGRDNELRRLFRPLRIDDSAFRNDTGWSPKFRLETTVALTAKWFQST